MKTAIKKISIMCILISAFVLTGSAVSGKKDASGLLDAKATKKHDASLYTSVDSMEYRMKKFPKPVIIDARIQSEFDRIRIPGSIHIPLYAIKTKAHLKSKTIILVNSGYSRTRLEETCQELRDMGFQVSILTGGLNAWKDKGNRLEGDVFAKRDISRVLPQDAFMEKDAAGNMVVDISKKPSRLFPHAIHLPDPGPKNLKALSVCGKQACAKTDKKKNRLILVVSEDGNDYGQIERMVKKEEINNIFYLSGGSKAYDTYMTKLALSLQPKEERIKTDSKCAKCGEENVE